MTVKTTKFGGTDWIDGDILTSADLNDTFNATFTTKWGKIRYIGENTADSVASLAGGSYICSANRESTDGGSTWGGGGVGETPAHHIVPCAANDQKAVAFLLTNGSIKYTTDAGSNWNYAVQPAETPVYMTYPANGSAFFVGAADATSVVWWSLDNGSTWTKGPGSPSSPVTGRCIEFISGASVTSGIVLDTDANTKIWLSVNGGSTWSFTGSQVGQGSVSLKWAGGEEFISVSSTGEVRKDNWNKQNWSAKTGQALEAKTATQMFKSKNGNVYFATYPSISGPGVNLWRSTDAGSSWDCAPLIAGPYRIYNDDAKCTPIAELGSGELLIGMGEFIMVVNEEY